MEIPDPVKNLIGWIETCRRMKEQRRLPEFRQENLARRWTYNEMNQVWGNFPTLRDEYMMRGWGDPRRDIVEGGLMPLTSEYEPDFTKAVDYWYEVGKYTQTSSSPKAKGVPEMPVAAEIPQAQLHMENPNAEYEWRVMLLLVNHYIDPQDIKEMERNFKAVAPSTEQGVLSGAQKSEILHSVVGDAPYMDLKALAGGIMNFIEQKMGKLREDDSYAEMVRPQFSAGDRVSLAEFLITHDGEGQLLAMIQGPLSVIEHPADADKLRLLEAEDPEYMQDLITLIDGIEAVYAYRFNEGRQQSL